MAAKTFVKELPMFSSRNFRGLMFKCLIHFELIFVSGVRYRGVVSFF